MPKYILKRMLISAVLLFFAAFIIYALMRCLPTSYIETIARQKSQQPGSKSYEEWMSQLTVSYGMDKGILAGYFQWLGNAVHGNSIQFQLHKSSAKQLVYLLLWVQFH